MQSFSKVCLGLVKNTFVFLSLSVFLTNGKTSKKTTVQIFIQIYTKTNNSFWFCVVVLLPVTCAPSDATKLNGTDSDDAAATCVHTLKAPTSFFKRHFDQSFLKKFFKHWVPFLSNERVKMQFFLYKRDFPECGREIITDDVESVTASGFNADHPTR